MSTPAPRWGIAVHLPKDDPMSAAHLLGDAWQGVRWYDSEADRNAAMDKMAAQPPWYRRGDTPSVRLQKIDP